MPVLFKRCLPWLLFVLGCLCQPALAARLNFERLLTGDSQSPSENLSGVNVIRQDAEGYMWFGGDSGLARYDGHRFKFYHFTQGQLGSLTGNEVHGLVVDQQGVLWAATTNGLNRYLAAEERFIKQPGIALEPAGDWVRALAVDANDNLWIGTDQGLVRLDPTRTQVRHFFHDANNPHSLSGNPVTSLLIDSKQRLWIGTRYTGLNRVDQIPGQDQPLHVVRAPMGEGPTDIPKAFITRMREDRFGHLWLATYGAGLLRLDATGTPQQHYRPASHPGLRSLIIRDLLEDHQGVLWLATDKGGLAQYRPETDDFYSHLNNAGDPESIYSNSPRCIAEDHNGDLWVGTFPEGINYLNRSRQVFENHRNYYGRKKSLSNNGVLSFLRDSDGDLWVGTEQGLNRYLPAEGKFQRFLKQPGQANALQSDTILSLLQDTDGSIWIGTWGGGLFRYNKTTGIFKQYRNTGQPGALNSDYVWSLLQDTSGQLWVGTETGGLSFYDRRQDSFHPLTATPSISSGLYDNFIPNLTQDAKGRVWVASKTGLHLWLSASRTFERRLPDNGDGQPMQIQDVLAHSSGELWIATQDRGILKYHPDTQSQAWITPREGLPSAYVSSLVQDDLGHVWATTAAGAARISVDGSIKVYSRGQGLAGNNFNRDAAFKDRNGDIFLGSTDGFSRFDPRQLSDNLATARSKITGIRLQGQNVPLQSLTRPQQPGTLFLHHQQNAITLEFSAMSFRASGQNRYQYILEGADRQWSNPSPQTHASYTNLSPGKYRFRLYGANSDGIWQEEELQLRIHISPPLWQSAWAYALYSVMLLGILVYATKMQRRRLDLHQAQALNDQLRKLDRMKNAFLANTSHELRTPLNGIIGLAESLAAGDSGPQNPQALDSLRMIVASGRRLSHLVSDILDFAKLTERRLALNLAPQAVKPAVDTVITLMQSAAQEKGLRLINDIPDPLPAVLADDTRLQQILFNLVGNAIKYTETGEVRISAFAQDDQITLKIADTGIGIPQDELENIFLAFNQLAHTDTRSIDGTGLGLAITKALVELQGGSLHVSSQLGEGSVFSVRLPISPDSPAPADSAQPTPNTNDYSQRFSSRSPTAPASDPNTPTTPDDKSGPTLLIVDDDPVNRMVLQRLLSREAYRLLEAADGEEALEQLARHPEIALVILDVMMPRLSGYDTCERLRHTRSTQNLPVIFLTAKDLHDDWVRGFLAGGNDFLTKPVAKQLLLERVQLHLPNTPADPLALNLEQQALQTASPLLLAMGDSSKHPSLADTLTRTCCQLLGDSSQVSCWVMTDTGYYLHAQNLGTALNPATKSSPLLGLGPKGELPHTNLPALQQLLNSIESGPGFAQLQASERRLIGGDNQLGEGEGCLLLPCYFEGRLLGFITALQPQAFNLAAQKQLKTLKPLLVAALQQLLRHKNSPNGSAPNPAPNPRLQQARH
jgi:two-component system, sensor histidine kinase ChiS